MNQQMDQQTIQQAGEQMGQRAERQTIQQAGRREMTTIRTSYWAVVGAALATLFASAVYYAVFGGVWMRLSGGIASTSPQAWEVAAQFGRNVIEMLVLATLMSWLRIVTWPGALRLGLLVWGGFQALAIAGSVIHEQYPVGLYVLHVGDALMTTLIAVSILVRWSRPRA
ncbi:DUF1761 domain-containing protein [Nonomuraea sp. NPDC050022]|uniref:DUF1761 domain-containing protein n=1 Tax=unclassified Nonomuraea TaxID=2593643 RepID=UPI0033FB4176